MQQGTSTALGLALGFALDRIFADPRRYHPVAGFGSAAAALEEVTYADERQAGVVHEVIAVGAVLGIGAIAARAGILATALATWTALGGRSLARAGHAMAERLDAGDLDGARELLPSLCGRDPSVLDADGLARAALESVAENTSDATVAPLLWGAVAGVPGLLGYRAVNTLDAMIGYRNERYLRFGWAAARTDDLANVVPARVTGVLTAALAPLVGGTPGAAWRAWRRDAAKHPSPNAGVVEASMAGALGVRLGGRTQYRHGAELRPTLGDGPAPTTADLRRAVRMSEAVQVGALVVSVVVAKGLRRR
ncbi:cobalamin biosynthesis protein [Nocardia asteroides NBRC 15531]|uniref:Cobalamin biosynthesis protein CobD n=1 Tax=Nocardia asteroides NBRC 15531 TaxID=1110697 RepID=U5EM78_NOCAS|nr:cobalamin biosynthesis protein [Nocardia asteroides]TLF63667.1 cobalamin biosynthesis protein [Nocardia asteroides NBRC 15531]UGT46872.1 cobalamin biosynthesis protein [Nocardia asteroides]SFM85990.1 adenosylcobinamide-phosphate synthase [Nocardia asteroides]VEG34271.1 cobalamin biosynthesis protein [Nocardia asteroides]GAD87433.1 cobalamin biosynthesis protein CobD [Nocardia asteroides NBRC 15531]